MVTGLECASVGGVQFGTLAPSGTGWIGGGLVGEVEKARICCLDRSGVSFDVCLNGELEVVDSKGCVCESRERKVAEKRRGGIDCFEKEEESFVFRIRCSARATALGSHIGQTGEEIRIVAAIAFPYME